MFIAGHIVLAFLVNQKAVPVHDLHATSPTLYTTDHQYHITGSFYAGLYGDVLPTGLLSTSPPKLYLAPYDSAVTWQNWPLLGSWASQATVSFPTTVSTSDGTMVSFDITLPSSLAPALQGFIAVTWHDRSHSHAMPAGTLGNNQETLFAIGTYGVSPSEELFGVPVRNHGPALTGARPSRLLSDTVIPIELHRPLTIWDEIAAGEEHFWSYRKVSANVQTLGYSKSENEPTFPLTAGDWSSIDHTVDDPVSHPEHERMYFSTALTYVMAFDNASTTSAGGSANEVDGFIRHVGL